MGSAYADIQWPERALDCLSESCSLCEAHGFSTIHPQVLNNLANHHLRLGEPARAFACVEQALTMAAAHPGSTYVLPYALHTQAECLRQLQRHDEALAALDRSAAALADQPNLPLQLRIQLDRASLLLQTGKPAAALAGLNQTLELAREHDLHRLRAEACLLTARIHRQLGNVEAGLAALDDYVAAQADATRLEQEAHRLAIAFLQQTEQSLEEAQRHARQVETLTLRLIDTQVQASRLAAQAATDPLTEAYNRQALLERLGELCAQEGPQPFSVLLIDCDDLKSINSELGAETGDLALRHIAQSVSRILRISDTFGRYGGDEFLVIAPNAGPASAATVAERIISTLDALPLSVKNRSIRITVSIGAACVPGSARLLPETCLRRAERSLSRARAQGPGRYAVARINLERPDDE